MMEGSMSKLARDYSILDKFGFERKPVGLKYLPNKPEGISHLTKELNFCEMLKEAQNTDPFYVTKGDFRCVEPMLLGFEDPEPILVSGLFGEKGKLFQEARANRNLYQVLPYMKKGSVHSVAFSPLDQLPFDPDALIITANVAQAQTLLRSLNYSTGEVISSKYTPVCSCAWMYNYPILTGEINYLITGLGLGMKTLNIFPSGLFIISIPWIKMNTVLENLQEMGVERIVSFHTPGPGGQQHRQNVKKIMEDLRRDIAS
jgi:uncharacterized protein (DUF169 family)